MQIMDLKEGDILIMDGKPYNRTNWFDCQSPDGKQYYRLEGDGGFLKFKGYEKIVHFSEHVYMLEI